MATESVLLTTPEAVAYLRICRATLYNLRKRKLIKVTKVAGSTRWSRNELDRYIARNTK